MAANIWQKITSERNLLDFFFRLRGLMLIASVGAILGALLMFWLGFLHLLHAYETLIGVETVPETAKELAAGADKHAGQARVVVYILEAVDAFLFALVLMIFAYGIALGFVFHHVSDRYRDYLPSWMLVEGVGQLKRTLAEVVIVVLIVIFARLVIESAGNLKWEMMVLPLSVVLLAVALKLLHAEDHAEENGHPPVKLFSESEPAASVSHDIKGSGEAAAKPTLASALKPPRRGKSPS